MTNVVVSGTYETSLGIPMTGWITFVSKLSGAASVRSETIVRVLDENGHFVAALRASDQDSFSWAYEVTENIRGVIRVYDLAVPASSATAGIDLPTVAPITYDDLVTLVGSGGGSGAVASVDGLTGVVDLSGSYQPLDSDLNAIAALTTTAFGRGVLTLANAAAGRTLWGLGTAATSASTDFQPIDADLTAIAALTTTSYGRALLAAADLAALYTILAVDSDPTLAANSNVKLATQAAIKAYVDQVIGAANGVVFKGVIDASSNPNYLAADAGHLYVISVAGKVGGSSGTLVEIGDLILCLTDGTVAGTQAAVGANWEAINKNLDGVVIGPSSSVASNLALFSGTTGKIIQDTGLSVQTSIAASDSQVPTSQAVLTALALKATLASPTLTGVPLTPTAATDTNTTQIASTAFVLGQASASGDGTPTMDGTAARGTGSHYARNDHVHPTDTTLAPKASPTFTGTPAAPTASPGTNTTQLATTAYADAIATLKANLASPTFTGTPAAPTAAVDTNTTQVATTAYVIAQAYAKLASPTFTGTPAAPTAAVDTNTTQIATTGYVVAQAASATPIIDGSATVGTSTRFARGDHVHPTDTSRAALASPTFTGTPAAPTASPGTNTTQLATTGYADAIAALKSSFTETVVAGGNSSTAKTIPAPNAAGGITTYTLTANCTFTMPTASAGQSFTVIINTGAGGFTLAFSGAHFPSGVSPVSTAAASKIDIYNFICYDGSTWFGFVSGQNYS